MEENIRPTRSFSYMSDTIGAIAEALSEFQGSIEQPKLEKDVKVRMKSGGQYSFKYADLSACVKAAAPVLKANGLAVAQIICDGKLITILTHKSGEWIKSELNLPPQTNDYQSYGSAITYLKRYSYCAILGIVADTDDDANIASGNTMEPQGNPNGINLNSMMYTGEQLQKALSDIQRTSSIAELTACWNHWSAQCPALTKNGSEFYKAAAQRRGEIAEATKKEIQSTIER